MVSRTTERPVNFLDLQQMGALKAQFILSLAVQKVSEGVRATAQTVAMQPTGPGILTAYRKVRGFPSIYRTALPQVLRGEIPQLEETTYPKLASFWLQGIMKGEDTVLSPKDTADFYRSIHPKDLKSGHFASRLVVSQQPEENARVVGAYVTVLDLDTTSNLVETVINIQDQLEQDKREHPNFFSPEAAVVVFEPKTLGNKTELITQGLYIHLLPFTLDEFRAWISDTYLNYRPKNYASLAEIHEGMNPKGRKHFQST